MFGITQIEVWDIPKFGITQMKVRDKANASLGLNQYKFWTPHIDGGYPEQIFGSSRSFVGQVTYKQFMKKAHEHFQHKMNFSLCCVVHSMQNVTVKKMLQSY